MPRQPQTPLTEEEKFKLQEQQEQELGCLQRQYCLLEKDRNQFACGAKLMRFNRVLSIYQKEHANIETDLEVASAPAKKHEDLKDSNNLGQLIEDHDFYAEEVKKQRKYIQEIDGQIKNVEKRVTQLRSEQITDRQHEDRIWAAITTIDQLMNKLDVQNKKFGMFCAKNRDMKLEIDRMLWERDVFMGIWNKMIDKLVMGKKFMMDLIEQATIAYDQREEWCSKLQALRLKAHHDFILHVQEMRELRRKQDNDQKLEEFFNIKGQKRVMRDLMRKEQFKRMENKIKLKDRMTEYKKYMNDILEFAKERQIQEIARKYYIQEAENFSLFKRLNNLIQELEFLSDELDTAQTSIDDEKELHNARARQQKNTIQSLQEDLQTITQEVEEDEQKLKETERYISQMLSGIDTLFKLCRCNNDPVLQLLGDNATINVYNALFYLEQVEKTVHEAMIRVYSHETRKKVSGTQRTVKDNRTKGELRNIEQFGVSNPCPLCFEYEMVSDVIDSLQHVLSRDEAKEVLAERLKSPEIAEKLHNVSACYLPKSREIIQKRYQ
ncbi:protein lava lamp-like [Tribolium madens]|uniref:protein lava lamp-like n=1 Tax=Tribolium madens TaxID=41895 RepID=UPI001CF7529C|nr:protein lava lamp-like [Tribolium madens]